MVLLGRNEETTLYPEIPESAIRTGFLWIGFVWRSVTTFWFLFLLGIFDENLFKVPAEEIRSGDLKHDQLHSLIGLGTPACISEAVGSWGIIFITKLKGLRFYSNTKMLASNNQSCKYLTSCEESRAWLVFFYPNQFTETLQLELLSKPSNGDLGLTANEAVHVNRE